MIIVWRIDMELNELLNVYKDFLEKIEELWRLL